MNTTALLMATQENGLTTQSAILGRYLLSFLKIWYLEQSRILQDTNVLGKNSDCLVIASKMNGTHIGFEVALERTWKNILQRSLTNFHLYTRKKICINFLIDNFLDTTYIMIKMMLLNVFLRETCIFLSFFFQFCFVFWLVLL